MTMLVISIYRFVALLQSSLVDFEFCLCYGVDLPPFELRVRGEQRPILLRSHLAKHINLLTLTPSTSSSMYFIFLVFQCTPVSLFWNRFLDAADGHCADKTTLANITYVHAALSALTDWIFGLLPVALVWRLKMNLRTKLSIVLILSLGFL
jgi:hypothetical protein